METSLTICYTANLAGDLHLLPRMHTFLRQLQQGMDGVILTVDLGGSCDPSRWPCDVTGGRAVLIALDAMGYDCANGTDITTQAGRDRLQEQTMMHLAYDGHPVLLPDVAIITHEADQIPDALSLMLGHSEDSSFDGNVIRLAPVEKGQIGVARLTDRHLSVEVHRLPGDTPPDTTIAGTISFIESEARYFQKRRDNPG